VIGLEATGKVTREDYEATVLPQIQQKQREFDKIRLMYVLGNEFEGYSAGAVWEDASLAFKKPGSWERIAVVSDSEWLRRAMALFSWMVPGEVKLFSVSETSDAKEWVTT
jgi:hypothetical protein